jgi:hypothetical protein
MRLRGHRVADYTTIAESLIMALAIELALHLMSVSSLLERLDQLQPERGWRLSCPSYRLEQFVSAAYRLLPLRPTCLRESLVLYALLRRRGAAPKLCVGVRKDSGGLAAHAWIECVGMTTGDEQTSFAELTTSP